MPVVAVFVLVLVFVVAAPVDAAVLVTPVPVAGFGAVGEAEPDVAGSATALPPAGKPLRTEALPTLPGVEPAVWAAAGTTPASNSTSRTAAVRIMRCQRARR
jgi:hypothetical protein